MIRSRCHGHCRPRVFQVDLFQRPQLPVPGVLPVGLCEIRSVYISKQEGGTNELDFLTRPLGSVSV